MPKANPPDGYVSVVEFSALVRRSYGTVHSRLGKIPQDQQYFDGHVRYIRRDYAERYEKEIIGKTKYPVSLVAS